MVTFFPGQSFSSKIAGWYVGLIDRRIMPPVADLPPFQPTVTVPPEPATEKLPKHSGWVGDTLKVLSPMAGIASTLAAESIATNASR